MKPEVAIVLPVYNVIEHIEEMIKCLYTTTDFPFKLIVVDGFSTDGTKEYFDMLIERKVYNNQNNIELYQIPKKGLVNAINFGIEKAKDLDVYLTQADVIHFRLYKRDWLENMHRIAQKDDVGLVIGIDGGGKSTHEFLQNFIWAGTWNTYISRDAINKIGMFDEQFSGGDDIDYSYRMFKKNLKLVMCDFWTQHHQLTDRNKTHSSEHLQEMGKLFRKKWGLDEVKK